MNCKECSPILLDNNLDAFTVFPFLQGQVITRGMDGVIVDINIPSVETVFDWFDVKNRKDCFIKIHRMFHYFLNKKED